MSKLFLCLVFACIIIRLEASVILFRNYDYIIYFYTLSEKDKIIYFQKTWSPLPDCYFNVISFLLCVVKMG